MSLIIKLTDSPKAFERKIINAAISYLNPVLQKTANNLKGPISHIIKKAIETCSECQSMIGGRLAADLGFVNGSFFVDALLRAVDQNIFIRMERLKFTGIDITGGITIEIIPADFKNFLNIPEGVYQSNQFDIPWLKWLLTEGNNIVVANYHVNFGSYKFSRSKQAIMKPGGTFRIPPEFSGYLQNNFITRALEGYTSDIEKIILQELERAL